MQGKLKIVPPVAPVHTVVRQNRVFKKDAQPLKILVDAIKHDDVRGDHQKITRQLRVRLIKFMKIAPCQHQAHHLGLAGACSHLHHKAPPGFIEHTGRDRPGMVKAHHVVLVLYSNHVIEIDDCFQRLPLGKVILELRHCPIRLRQ